MLRECQLNFFLEASNTEAMRAVPILVETLAISSIMLRLAGSHILVLLLLRVLGSKSKSQLFVALSSLADKVLCASHGEDEKLAVENFYQRM